MEKVVLFSSIVYKPKKIEYFFDHFIKNRSYPLLFVLNEIKGMHTRDFDHAEKIRNEKNLGFAKAANQAINYAIKNKYAYLCLFNQDVKLNPEDIYKLIPLFTGNPDLAILSPFHKKNASDTEYYFNQILLQNNIQPPYHDLYFVPFVHAACWVIDLKKIAQIGGFNPLFFMYGEDLNLCHRTLHKGFKIGIATQTKIIHDKIDREYDEVFVKKLKANATYTLATCLNPLNKAHIFVVLFKKLFHAFKSLIKFQFKLFFLHFYAFAYLLFKLPYISKFRKEQDSPNSFLKHD